MANRFKSVIIAVPFICVVLLCLHNFESLRLNYPVFSYSTVDSGRLELPDTDSTKLTINTNIKEQIYFVGDVMLARDVERTMLSKGYGYPYQGIQFDKDTSYVFGNFESAIPLAHIPTPNNTFKFSVNEIFLPELRAAGFTHMSLANNHTFDYGRSGYNNTITKLWDQDIEPFGHPSVFSTSSISIVELGEVKVSVIALHTLFGAPTEKNINEVLSLASKLSDMQIVYVHWGDEYSKLPSMTQKKLAKKLSDAGADVIIGHHPHVVQSIEKINDTYIFYSLGNFIFDQYFSPDVQTGLMLKIVLGEQTYIDILPITSLENRLQPKQMAGQDRDVYLGKLSELSSPELTDLIKLGQIPLNLVLATSTEVAIMAE